MLEFSAVELHRDHLRRAEKERLLRQVVAAGRDARPGARVGYRLRLAGGYLLHVARVTRPVRAMAPRRAIARGGTDVVVVGA